MQDFLLGHEAVVRLAVFGGVFGVLASWQSIAPFRVSRYSRLARWWTNLALSGTSTLLVRFTLPLAAMGVAVWAEARGFGLFNLLGLPTVLSLPLSLTALDLLIYAQHAVFHHVPLLWRLHRVHHADPELDVTTGIRFHPVEIFVSMAVKMAAVAALGISPLAVLLFEIVLNAMAMFNHTNVALPPRTEMLLRCAIVTPEMHRVHHSVRRDEHDMNFGFNLSVWDRLFGTYLGGPRDGIEGLRIGLDAYPGLEPTKLLWTLALPFRGGAARALGKKAR